MEQFKLFFVFFPASEVSRVLQVLQPLVQADPGRALPLPGHGSPELPHLAEGHIPGQGKEPVRRGARYTIDFPQFRIVHFELVRAGNGFSYPYVRAAQGFQNKQKGYEFLSLLGKYSSEVPFSYE